MGRSSIPCSTYRLQFTEEFGFVHARQALDYLDRLGITDVYCSPLLRAAPGSTHGYDVVDPTMLDPKLGTRAEFDAFSAALRERSMGLILDIVPNHMAATPDNPWWRDVLQRGAESHYANYFDIDWQAGGGRLLLPILGAPLPDVLAAGELTIEDDELIYYDSRLPLASGTAALADLASIVDAQHYELAYWREQATRLNYRRFFDITGLVGMRVEDEQVFDDLHAFVLQLVREGHVTGIRVDHIDGLRDPRGYLERLQHELRSAAGSPNEPFYVVVEKILAPNEVLPESWQVAGTTGYQFLDACDGLFVDPYGADRLAERYAESIEHDATFDDVVDQAKLRIMRDVFWGELGRLAAMVPTDASTDGTDTDTESDRRIRDAIAVVTASLPVYRTYVELDTRSAEDERLIERALSDAAARPGVDPIALAKVAHALRDIPEFAMRWQQFSGPVTAKSVEDTAFYRYQAIPARNEVGAHPSNPAAAIGSFHWLVGNLATDWPHTMNTASTHDTKRSEDVRARLLVLTQHPDEWSQIVEGWLERFDAPDANNGWMVASALVGAWPLDADRLAAYVQKALREEKRHTSWTQPDDEFEAAMLAFAERLRTSGDIEPIVERFDTAGRRNALAAAALKLFAPGVPDTYQGTERQALALVDPDNRRPVDYTALDALLDSPDAPHKLRTVAGMLRARRDHRELFTGGEYLPLRHEGPGVVTFARRLGTEWALVAVARPGFRADAQTLIELPDDAPHIWRNVVTGSLVDLAATPVSPLLNVVSALALVGTSEPEPIIARP